MLSRPRPRDLTHLLLLLGIIAAVNVLGGIFFTRIDLTSEKRYTLSKPTRDLLRNVDDVIYLKVYLDGELPAGFRRLRDRTREMLDEFRAQSGNRIEYRFINPSDQPDEKSRNELFRQLAKQGIAPTNIQIKGTDGVEQKLIFPGAILSYRNTEVPLQLLQSRMGASPEQMLNSSIEELEYELTNAVRKALSERSEAVAFIEGYGMLSQRRTADLGRALSEYYTVSRVSIDGKLGSLLEHKGLRDSIAVRPIYKAIILAKPDSALSEKDKFIIDQYVMAGGRVLWLIEPVLCNMDSLQYQPSTIALPIKVNVDDMLFRYGARVNTDLLQDVRCASIPGPSGYVGDQLQWALQPWVYFPIVIPTGGHPIVRNLNGIKLEFASSIDTVNAPGIRKTVLLATSERSRALRTPAKVSLETMLQEPRPDQFNQRHLPVAVLLEGRFESVFKNRIPPSLRDSPEIGFRDRGAPSRMIVVSDGDLAKNHVNQDGTILPCGFDRFTQQQYGTKKFLLNAVNYLCDDEGMLTVRSRSLQIRLLDRKRIEAERSGWQAVNVAGPIALVLLFGAVYAAWRRRRHSKR